MSDEAASTFSRPVRDPDRVMAVAKALRDLEDPAGAIREDHRRAALVAVEAIDDHERDQASGE
jgi:hypothetical protein